ncbi:hypothetical protein F5051DRAFT_444680 [Lentinula edodes]|nr:hypothetical protein F5051DRAFT_444680 [Lentinula edodes]
MTSNSPSSFSSIESSQSASRQILMRQKLGELISHHSESSEPKRGRDSGGENESMMMMKKRRKLSVDNDLPQYTLHSLSITSPIRKKVDITIHERTVRTSTSGKFTTTKILSLPLSALCRAFGLPTRGEGKGKKGKGVMVNDDKEKEQIIFGLDATMNGTLIYTTSYTMSHTTHTSMRVRQYKQTVGVLTEFMARLGRGVQRHHLVVQTNIDNFECLSSTHTLILPTLAIPANLGAKPGRLWFTPIGILWAESRLCMFWSLGDLTSMGVRTISTTGRVCTVVLTRTGTTEEEEEETVFGQIEGEEQEVVNSWVRMHKGEFGGSMGGTQSQHQSNPRPGPLTIYQLVLDSDDDDGDGELHDTEGSGSEEDCREDSATDLALVEEQEDPGGSGQSGSNNDHDHDHEGGGGRRAEEDDELALTHHPPLLLGVMPKISRTAVDMAVGMNERDVSGDDDLDSEEGEDWGTQGSCKYRYRLSTTSMQSST